QLGAPGFPEQRTAIAGHLESEEGFYAVYSGEFQLVNTYESEDALVAAYDGRDPGEITICRFNGQGGVEACWNASGELVDGENWREMEAPAELNYAYLQNRL
ncbi:hypothetical protein KY362_00580, partial [Candidatus Woesearchaeota archaeon]|nr:hypothetical protein [Candidatus Woesearchaeota archaeon]